MFWTKLLVNIICREDPRIALIAFNQSWFDRFINDWIHFKSPSNQSAAIGWIRLKCPDSSKPTLQWNSSVQRIGIHIISLASETLIPEQLLRMLLLRLLIFIGFQMFWCSDPSRLSLHSSRSDALSVWLLEIIFQLQLSRESRHANPGIRSLWKSRKFSVGTFGTYAISIENSKNRQIPNAQVVSVSAQTSGSEGSSGYWITACPETLSAYPDLHSPSNAFDGTY